MDVFHFLIVDILPNYEEPKALLTRFFENGGLVR